MDRFRVPDLITDRADLLASNLIAIFEGVESSIIANGDCSLLLFDEVLFWLIIRNRWTMATECGQWWPLQLGLGEHVSAFLHWPVY